MNRFRGLDPKLALGIALIAISKLVQLAIDAQPLLYIDSIEILHNGFHASNPERSYFLGRFIRLVSGPFHSLTPFVIFQAIAGAVTAVILMVVLRRYAQVPHWLALAAALLLAWDPTQVIHERLVMTECAAGLCGAFFLWNSLEYLRTQRSHRLLTMSILGLGLVSLRVLYIPIVWALALLLPLIAHFPYRGWRPLGRALLLGLTATLICQTAYRQLTGLYLQRQPAYQYRNGIFLLGNVAPLIQPDDATSPQASEIIRTQNQTVHPLDDSSPEGRGQQLWGRDGLIDRLRLIFPEQHDLNQRAQEIAINAIRRNPIGFLQLGITGLADCLKLMGPPLKDQLRAEDGYRTTPQPSVADWKFVNEHFDSTTPQSNSLFTPSRAYHLYGIPWMWVQIGSPLLGLFALLGAQPNTRMLILWIALWPSLLLATTCLGSPLALRYLHPLSFPGLALLAVLAHWLSNRINPMRGETLFRLPDVQLPTAPPPPAPQTQSLPPSPSSPAH